MENAVFASRRTVLVMTPAYMQSEWARFEQILTQTQDPIGLRQRTLPLLREPCDVPPRIAMLTHVDLREGADVAFEFDKLVRAARDVRSLPDAGSVAVGRTGPASPAPIYPADTRDYDPAVVRELLTAALSDQELSDLAFDHFRPVYDTFSSGMSRQQKIQGLLEYCELQRDLERLLALVQTKNPAQYVRHAGHLRRSPQAGAERGASSSTGPTVPVKSLSPNPFAATLAVRDPACFVGRQAELRRLQALLQGGSVTLLGEPKIGKSSLLWRLKKAWPGRVLGPFDCQEWDDPADFYAGLAESLALSVSGWRAIRRALLAGPALLLLDELDAEAAERAFKPEALGRLRAVCGAHPGFKVVAVSRRPLKEVFPDSGKGSPPYNFLSPLTLGPLTEQEARLLLGHVWAPAAPAFDAQTVERLLALAGTHPFKLQRAAFQRYEALGDPGYEWQAAYRQDLEHLL